MGNPTKKVIAFRASREIADRVREIARREDESESSVLRRLVRSALQTEQRAAADRG